MAKDCNVYVKHSFISENFLSDEIKELYIKFLGMSYVEESKSVKWCPAAGC